MPAAWLLLLALVALSGCGSATAPDYPRLEPLDDLLAQADAAFSTSAGQ